MVNQTTAASSSNWFSLRRNATGTKDPQLILVTGASSGIGKASALQLIARGHIVYGAARRLEKMQDLVEAGGHAIGMDVTNEEQVSAGLERIMKEQGRIDVLFNNAGIDKYCPAEDMPMDEFRKVLEVNFFSVVNLTQKALRYMRKQEKTTTELSNKGPCSCRRGLILNTSSVGGVVYGPLMSCHYASKHALEGWCDCLRVELAPYDIQVSIIQPGFVNTGIIDAAKNCTPEDSVYRPAVDRVLQGAPEYMKRGSDPSVIADLVVRAIESKSPKRRYMGGRMAYPFYFLRTWLGDGVFDFVIRQRMKGVEKEHEKSSVANGKESTPVRPA